MTKVRVVIMAALAAGALTACGGDDSNFVRGRDLTVATHPAATEARIYAAAGGIPDGVVTEMRLRGTIKGTCEPALTATRGTARCTAEYPGYVLRFSPIFTLKGDSVQVYVYAQKYDTPASGHSETLRFERAYQIAKLGDDWRAVREGHVPREARGER